MKAVETPVLIVGGGGTGLTASMLLAKLGVESQLVSPLPGKAEGVLHSPDPASALAAALSSILGRGVAAEAR